MKYLSIFSGIEAASVAWEPIGFKPVGFAEIEPFSAAVLRYRFPTIPNFGDVTKYKEWQIEPESVDIIVGGSPCQSFSVAGLRKGINDPRGNLMLTYGAIAGHFKPPWIVWENVPGVLSSNKGQDFRAFLRILAELGYGFAYRILDAQYVRVESHRRAVPQRRRRVFVVGYLGDWRRAAAVLFESESFSRYTPPSREAGERVAPTVSAGPPFSRTGNERIEAEAMIPVCPALTSSGRGVERAGETRGQDPVIVVRQPYEVGNRLTSSMTKGFNTTLDAGHTPVITASANLGMKQPGYCVRRLTPRECERLQGFPDDWTQIPWRKKEAENCPDGPRYKAIGNSMAVNVMRWIGERIIKDIKKP